MGILLTAVAQLRFATSLVFGRPFSPWALERLIDALQETQQEFGALNADSIDQLSGPVFDEHDRREMQLRRLRTQ